MYKRKSKIIILYEVLKTIWNGGELVKMVTLRSWWGKTGSVAAVDSLSSFSSGYYLSAGGPMYVGQRGLRLVSVFWL